METLSKQTSNTLNPRVWLFWIPPTKFAEDLLLFISRGEEDFGVEALGLEALPRRSLGAGSVPRFHLNVQVDLKQVWVLLLDVTGI